MGKHYFTVVWISSKWNFLNFRVCPLKGISAGFLYKVICFLTNIQCCRELFLTKVDRFFWKGIFSPSNFLHVAILGYDNMAKQPNMKWMSEEINWKINFMFFSILNICFVFQFILGSCDFIQNLFIYMAVSFREMASLWYDVYAASE